MFKNNLYLVLIVISVIFLVSVVGCSQDRIYQQTEKNLTDVEKTAPDVNDNTSILEQDEPQIEKKQGECIKDKDCGPLFECPDGYKYEQFVCEQGYCLRLNYFADPCNPMNR